MMGLDTTKNIYQVMERESSMRAQSQEQKNTVFVEYCRACDTHSWCTHHDEEKYHHTFLKVSEAISQNFPQLQVVGNLLPSYLLPFKIHENKYIDSRTNKYTLFPTIGAFEITFQQHVLFSKKDTVNWPSLPHLLHKINSILHPDDPQSPPPPPPKKHKSPKISPKRQTFESHATIASETLTEKVGGGCSQSMRDSELTVHQQRSSARQNVKGFTLTDHFKQYRQKAPISQKEYMTEQSNNSIESRPFIEGRLSEEGSRSSERKGRNELAGEGTLRDILRSKGAVVGGRKEMIINLDSIEEEVNDELVMSIRNQERHPTTNEKMFELQSQMSSLENKFNKFESKVHTIQAQSKQFELGNSRHKNKTPNILEKIEKQQMQKEQQSMLADKTNRLDAYLAATEKQKNEQLHRIYGEWKINKHNKLGKKQFSPQPHHFEEEPSNDDRPVGLPPPSHGKLTFKAKKKAGSKGQHHFSSQPKFNEPDHKVSVPVARTSDQFYQVRKESQGCPKKQNDLDIVSNLGAKLAKKGMIRRGSGSPQQMQFSQKELEEQKFSRGAIQNIHKINQRISHLHQSIDEHQRQESKIKKKQQWWTEEQKSGSQNQSQCPPKPFRHTKPPKAKFNQQKTIDVLHRSPSKGRNLSQSRPNNSGEEEDTETVKQISKKHLRGSSKQFKVREGRRALVSQERVGTNKNKSPSPSRYHPEQQQPEQYDDSYQVKQVPQFVYKPHQARQAKPRQRKFKEWRESKRQYESRARDNSDRSMSRGSPSPMKRSAKQKKVNKKKDTPKKKEKQYGMDLREPSQVQVNFEELATQKIRYGKIKKNRCVEIDRNRCSEQQRQEVREEEQFSEPEYTEEEVQMSEPFSKQEQGQYESVHKSKSVQESYFQKKAALKAKMNKTLGFFKIEGIYFTGHESPRQSRVQSQHSAVVSRSESQSKVEARSIRSNSVASQQSHTSVQPQRSTVSSLNKTEKARPMIDVPAQKSRFCDLDQIVSKQYASFIANRVSSWMVQEETLNRQGKNFEGKLPSPIGKEQISSFTSYESNEPVLIPNASGIGMEVDAFLAEIEQDIAGNTLREAAVQVTAKVQPQASNIQSGLQYSEQVSVPSHSSYKIDNVYSEAKSARFVQVGVQKQLTFQVSIQTEEDLGCHSPVTMSPIVQASPQDPSIKVHRDESIEEAPENEEVSEISQTFKNEYLNMTSSIHPKKLDCKVIRARILDQIFSADLRKQQSKFDDVLRGLNDRVATERGQIARIEDVYPEGVLLQEKNLELQMVESRLSSMMTVLQILCERGQWLITRLFEDCTQTLKGKPFGVWLCKQYQWECYLLDRTIRVDEQSSPIYSLHKGGQYWVNVMEKALSLALGGYESLEKADTGVIFSLLTGCNAIPLKIKEDPSKNARTLSMIKECLRKNFVVHCEKGGRENRHIEGKVPVYQILSVRKGSGEEEQLVEISQNGKESFWVKLSKFVQEFKRVEVLQLRMHHKFGHIDIGIGQQQKLTVVEMGFAEEGQGCVTLAYLEGMGPLKAHLYREQRNKVLKLVGQAKEKCKNSLFFECNFNEGRYYVFIQAEQRPVRLSYLGEGCPSLRVTEEIKSKGLNNAQAEYMPVKQKLSLRREESLMQSLRGSMRGGRSGISRNDMNAGLLESKLRDDFVDYILRNTRKGQYDD